MWPRGKWPQFNNVNSPNYGQDFFCYQEDHWFTIYGYDTNRILCPLNAKIIQPIIVKNVFCLTRVNPVCFNKRLNKQF